MPPFDQEFFGGKDRLELEARSLFGLLSQLESLAPGFSDLADVRAAFAVDGVVQPDWSTSLEGVQEVIVLQRVAGG